MNQNHFDQPLATMEAISRHEPPNAYNCALHFSHSNEGDLPVGAEMTWHHASVGPIGSNQPLRAPPVFSLPPDCLVGLASAKQYRKCIAGYPAECTELVVWFSRQPWAEVTQASFLDWATADKFKSLALQIFIENCPRDTLLIVGELTFENLDPLVVHRQGSYVVQKILGRSRFFRQWLGLILSMSFEEYVQNEFSSRVLEKLASVNHTFRTLGIRMFCSNWNTLIVSLPAVMFLCACIRAASDPFCFELVKENLFHHPEYLFTSKKYKRVLIVYSEVCDLSHLEQLFFKMMEQKYFVELLDDKLLVQIVFHMVKRQFEPMILLLEEQISYNLLKLLETSHFFQLMQNLAVETGDPESKPILDLHFKQFVDLKQELARRGQMPSQKLLRNFTKFLLAYVRPYLDGDDFEEAQILPLGQYSPFAHFPQTERGSSEDFNVHFR